MHGAVLQISDVVESVSKSLWTVMELHVSLRHAEVVLFVEANYDPVQSTGIAFGLRDAMSLHRVRVIIYSDDVKHASMPRPGHVLTNERKRVYIDKLLEFLALESLVLASRVVCQQGVTLPELRRQLVHYEYEPIVERSSGIITGYRYHGKRHGPDDMATILFSALALAVVWMSHDAEEPYRRRFVGDVNAVLRDDNPAITNRLMQRQSA